MPFVDGDEISGTHSIEGSSPKRPSEGGRIRCGREMGHFYFKKGGRNDEKGATGEGPLSYLSKVKSNKESKKKTRGKRDVLPRNELGINENGDVNQGELFDVDGIRGGGKGDVIKTCVCLF